MRFDLGLGLARHGATAPGGGPIDPVSLFAGSESGYWYDPSDLTSLYTDAGITNVSADGQSVYRAADKSGNGLHADSTSSTRRPLYKTAAGLHWLQFDGVNDLFNAPAVNASATDLTLCAALSASGMTTFHYLIDYQTGRLVFSLYETTGHDIALFNGSWKNSGVAFPTSGVHVVTFILSDPGYSIRLDGAEIDSGLHTNLAVNGTAKWGGSYDAGDGYLQHNCFGLLLIDRGLDGAEIAGIEAFMAGKAGN